MTPPSRSSRPSAPPLLLPPPPSASGPPRKAALLPQPRRTHAAVWCTAVACIVFSILIILSGAAVLIVFLVVQPKHPAVDAAGAILNSIYLDTPEYLNADFTLLANFSNPNRKIGVRFEALGLELYFMNSLITVQSLQPFYLRSGGARMESVHMISSEVRLPLQHSLELQKQVQSNRVQYSIRGSFRVRADLGIGHFTYWLYCRCAVELTGPPGGVLLSRSCHRTKKWR